MEAFTICKVNMCLQILVYTLLDVLKLGEVKLTLSGLTSEFVPSSLT